MGKARRLGRWLFAAGVIATIVNTGVTRSGTTDAAAIADVAQTPPTGRSDATVSADDHDIDTLDTIGESLAVDLSTEGLRQRATRSLEILQSPTIPTSPQPENAIDFLEAFLALPIRHTEGLDKARMAVAVLDGEYRKDAASLESGNRIRGGAIDDVDRFLARYFDHYALNDQHANKEDVLLARDFEQLDKTELKITVLEQAVRDGRNHVAFLIATLPDPIDSYTGWQFDPMLDAIAQAVAASDYVLDRFHFPDSDKEEASTSRSTAERGRVHELEPGVVIFKKHVEPDSKSTYGDRLVLLLVHENPAAGIHTRALANAIRLVVSCRSLMETDPSNTKPTVRILGPTFSGSSESLNRALRMSEERLDEYTVRVMSGSATDPKNKHTIENSLSHHGQVTFHATVHPDDVLLPQIVTQIAGAEWSKRIAVLFEANTQYGRNLWEVLWRSRQQNSAFDLIQLPFPMNVSRLRTTVEAQDPAHTGPLGRPSRFRPLPMEAQGNPSDQIPQFNSKTTATYVELALAGMLETMDREHVKTVALMATDPRDKLFLAEQIARYSPDVSIFTVESDSLYIHPDYSSYLRGALVVSTYPLYSGNQSWSYGYQGDSERRQFANGSAQGIYNAALALLDYDADGRPTSDTSPRLLEYGLPGEPCEICRPPVWISVVGRSSAWPIRAYLDEHPSDYVFPVMPTAVWRPPRVFPSPPFHALLILLTFAILIGWATQGIGGFRAPAGSEQWSLHLDDADPAQRVYLLICLIGVLLIQTFVGELCLIRVRIGDRSGPAVVALVAASVGIVAACHMIARVLAALVRQGPILARRALSWRRISTWGAAAAAVVCAWSIWNVAWYLRDNAVRDRSDVVSFLARAVDFWNGVCPTLPVLFLGSALTLWGVTELWRVRRGRVALADTAVHPLIQETVYADVETLTSPWNLLNRSILTVPPGGVVVVALVSIATCLFVFDPFTSWLVTIEGPRFGRFVSATLLLVQVMLMLALVQFGFLWSSIKRLLELMARHKLADTYERVPRELFPADLFPRVPRLADLQIPVSLCVRRRLVGPGFPARPHVGGVPEEWRSLDAMFQKEMGTAPDTPWATSKTWKALLNAASYTAGRPHERTRESAAQVRGAQVPPTFNAAAVAHVIAADLAVVQREEELPAMLVAFVIKDALARLAHNLVFVIGGVVLMFCSYTLFPFQQHTQLQVLGWIYVSVTFTTILTVLAQIKRNEIIASLTSTAPGLRTTWDREFVLKVALFALLPLFTLFAAQFPDIGGLILRWMEPVQSALP